MLCNPAFPPIPASEAELRSVFGDIRRYIRADGTLSPTWETEQIVRVKLPSPIAYAYGSTPITRVTVHRKLANAARLLFAEVWARDLVTALGDFGGGFVYRPNRNNASAISLHAYGIAWDFDPVGFPNGSKKKRDPRLVELFAGFGFRCGQDFRGTPDPMHFVHAAAPLG